MSAPIVGKPRIRLRFGVWCCVTQRPFVCGCGYTLQDAYSEWVALGGQPVFHGKHMHGEAAR